VNDGGLPIVPPPAEHLRWESLPPPWALALLVVPAAILLVWLAYRREDLTRGQRLALGALRLGAVLAGVLLLFGPYMERTVEKVVKSHLVVLVDTSASMAVADDVDPASAAALSRATGVPEGELRSTPRLDLARRALMREGTETVLERLRRDFTLHVHAFAGEPRTLWSADETREEGSGAGLREALDSLRPDGAATRIGDSAIAAVEDYRLRSEPLAGVVLVTDGRQTSGTHSSREAAEYARSFLQRARGGQRGVPLFPVVAGDPSSSRNVQVRNLVAPEVVLARDDASFEFDVVERGFDGENGVLRLMFLEPPGENATLVPGEVRLAPGDAGVRVKGRHRFDRPGLYRVRVGVPPLPGERIAEDNWVDHQIRVVDRKVKVLYVDGRPRREWESLQRALTRDSETLLVHTLQLESTDQVPQPRTDAPNWPALAVNRFPETRRELFEYDVVILGDVDYRSRPFALTPEEGLARLGDLRDFVEAGGGLLCIAGEYHMPLEYRRTPLAEVLPVVVDPDEVARTRRRTADSFNLRLTPEGRESPLLRIDEDPKRSADLWETMTRWRHWWYFPVRRAASGARVLAVHPEGEEEFRGGDPDQHANRYGPHVLVATKSFGLGRSLWIGSDELWRMRYGVGDQFYYAFYAKAIRYLASYRLLGGNRRVKIHPERQTYYLDEPVAILGHVVGEDYRPPSPLEKPKVSAVVTWPDRTEHPLDLLPVPQAEGEPPLGLYRGTFSPAVPGTYTVAPDPAEVPGEEPEPKSFAVQSSAEEQRDPGVDAEALQALADISGGRLFTLATAKDLPGAIPTRKSTVPVEARPDPLVNQWWIPVALTLLLACEWMLRKRWRLL
jgi:hypothetical protein